jgi:NAD(P)-dependent dehydrogenase (short-subunit alcohol dehydrogenase family)
MVGPFDRFDGTTAFITGASSGIGEATARQLVAEGARVALVARRVDRLAELAEELGGSVMPVAADVADSVAVRTAVDEVEDQLGSISLLVNAAGIAKPALLGDVSDEDWRSMIDVNLSGTFFPCREIGLRMRDGSGGSIVNLGSELSFFGMEMCAPYCAAKAGIIGLTRALAVELAPTVRVNVVCPGPVDTPMLAGEFALFPDPDGIRQATVDRLPLKRLAAPEEIAEAILFAAVSPFATGSPFMIDGGSTSV